MSKTARALSALLASFLPLIVPAHAQTSAPVAATPAQSTAGQSSAESSPDTVYKSATVLKYTTRLVVVDVIATDHKGNPVTDLEKQDFVLQEDGKNQGIEVFSLQRQDSRNRTSSPRPLPKLPPNIVTNAPQYNVAGPLTVLLLDGLNTESKNQVYARDQMIKFLEKLPADQPIAVYALGTKLQLLQDFTTDPALLKSAVMAMQARNSPLLNNPTGAGGNHTAVAAGAMEQMPPGLAQQIQQFEQDATTAQTDLRVDLTLAALNALARALAGYPGRKNLIWLSQGFPLSLQANAIPLEGSPRTHMNNRDYSAQSALTASILTDAQIAVYPVDIGTLVGNQVYASLSNTDENGNYLGRTLSGRSAGGNVAGHNELDRTSIEQFNAHGSMNLIADRTGGRAFYNRNDVESAINKTLDDGSTYYTLAYHPLDRDWNGKFRQINVKVQRAGVKLRYRSGYYAVDPMAFEKMDQRQRSVEFGQAFNPDFPVSTAIMFQANVSLPSGQNNHKVTVSYRIDPHMILFEADAQGQHAEVDYAAAVYSKTSQVVKMQGQTMKTAFPPDAFQQVMKSYLPCQLQFDLPPGEYNLRLGIRDDRTGLIGTVDTALTIPAEEKTR